MSALTTFSVELANETATAQLMADLALLVRPGDVITLSGDLGARKTAAARPMQSYERNAMSLQQQYRVLEKLA
jgi:tRNA A37 threonylcarbamoyladenosine biosynthesis protein TsaE